jgi:DNA sulfur modification protein DndC
MLTKLDYNTIELIEKEYKKNELPWSIGYSGGKDSTALLKLTFQAVLRSNNKLKPINIVYYDTGVEIPIISLLVDKTLKKIKKESQTLGLPFNCIKINPKLNDRYFVKVIGRGYPPPTNIFRWCTDKLRVIPVQTFLRTHSKENVVLLGVRKGESYERDKIILKHYLENVYYFRQNNFKQTKIFSPILNYNEDNVWETILNDSLPTSINGKELRKYYTLVQNTQGNLIGGRFGCWTCTVVRKDKAVMNLIEAGYIDLIPLLSFRNWLISIRDNPMYRCKHRRNGEIAHGPFTLEARSLILKILLKAQNESGYKLINEEELDLIHKSWFLDQNSKSYREN